jgi:hypothetical protein
MNDRVRDMRWMNRVTQKRKQDDMTRGRTIEAEIGLQCRNERRNRENVRYEPVTCKSMNKNKATQR